jgi:hypothetical protein
MPEVPKHVHTPPEIPDSAFVGDPDTPWKAIASILQDTVVEPVDRLVQHFLPDETYAVSAEFCQYYWLKEPVPAGMRARVEINGNEDHGPTYGAVEIFVTPVGGPLPPAGNPNARTTFGGNGETTVNGPGVITIHLKTNTPAPKIRVWIEQQT